MKSVRQLSRFNLIFIADTVYSLHQWMILTLLIKWSTPLNIGYFNYALALTAPIVMFCWLNASTILTAERSGLKNFNLFIKTRFSLLADRSESSSFSASTTSSVKPISSG